MPYIKIKNLLNFFLLITIISILSFGVLAYDQNPIQNKIHTDLWKKINGEKTLKQKYWISSIQKAPIEEKITVLIEVDEKKNLDDIADYTQNKESKIIGKYKLGNVVVAEVPINKIEEISKNNKINSIWPNREYHILLDKSVPQINAPFMWGKGYNGSGVKIAILDTGIDSSHPMVAGKVILEEVFTGEGYTTDGNGHGTHCAGIATGNGELKGVAPGALLINAKVMTDSGSGDEASIIAGINWAVNPDGNESTDDGADIISMSLGGSYSDINSPIVNAVKDAVDNGVVVVVASGNCGPICPSTNCYGYTGVGTPGLSPDAITIGAVDDNNNWACFSSGEDIPGVGIKPDVVAPGVYINSSIPGGYAPQSGTSMATPHVAGAAALLLQSNPDLTPEQVKYVIEKTALRLGDPGKDIRYGSGLIDTSNFIPPNVNKILKYKLEYPEYLYLNEKFSVVINSTTPDIVDVNGVITTSENSIFSLNFTNISNHIWKADFYNTSDLGIYQFNISISDIFGNTIIFNEEFDVIRYPTDGYISLINIPAQIVYNNSLPIEVIFENIGDTTLNTIIEAQIIENEIIIDSIESDFKNVTPYSNSLFHLNWTATSGLGAKTLKAIATFNGQSHIKEKDFEITDNIAPIITNIYYKSDINKNNPFLIEIDLEDLSNIKGNITIIDPLDSIKTIQLRQLSKINNQITLVGAYEDTFELGTYIFNFALCDAASNCVSSSDYSFIVHDCSNPQILIVSEEEILNNSLKYTNALSADYCMSVWDEFKSQTPTLSYLNRFDAVVWSAGNYFSSNIDEDSSQVLQQYVDSNGKLLVEGPDIALSHISDGFMENVTHSIFEKDFDLANNSDVSIIKKLQHPIFKDLPDEIPYNSSKNPYPDSVSSINNGVELAEWSLNDSAVVVYNNLAKILFLPFMANALEENQDTFIQNIIEWLLIDNNNPDLIVNSIQNDYLIEGSNTINIEIENIGSIDANNAKVEIFIDDVLQDTTYIDVNSGSKITINPTISLIAGYHTIKVILNSDFNVVEKNYLNNLKEKSLRVATIEADLILKNLYPIVNGSSSNIITEISNIGGTNALNVPVKFYLNDILNKTEYFDLNYNKKINISFDGPSEKGIFDIKAVINPDETVIESNYTNNNMTSELYICSRSPILIVDDDDTESYSTDKPSSADDFEAILKNNDYCTFVWKESEKGIPSLDELNNYDLVIWSSGDYWNTAINESDVLLLEQYDGNILFEGADIAFEHGNDTFMTEKLHSVLDKDLILNETTEIIFSSNILGDISSIFIDDSLCKYPDSVTPLNGISVANWSNEKNAIIAYNDSDSKIAYFAFSIDAVIDQKEELILNTMKWLGVSCVDNDGDGYYSISEYCLEGNDCNDTNTDVNPGAAEICDNLDNDCDGTTDEDLTQPTTCGVGTCTGNTGTETCSAGTWGGDTCDPYAGASADDATCDGIDDDCNGVNDEDYVSNESCFLPGACATDNLASSCTNGAETLCSTGTPADDDTLCNNIDDNCNGEIDEGYAPTETSCGTGACQATGILLCTDGTEVDSCTEGTPSDEVCEGSIDENCDGTVDENCECTDGKTKQCGTTDVGACEYGTRTCSAGSWGSCVGEIEPTIEICNDIDDDCDSLTDEDLTQPTTCGVGVCSDNTGYETCTAGIWEGDTCDPYQGATSETCEGSIDENCDGTVDEGCECTNGDTQQCGTIDVGECSLGTQTCQSDGTWGTECVGEISPVPELCDNKDNDCDGNVDEDFNKNTDINNCGSCGNVCNPDEICNNGFCKVKSVCGDELCEGPEEYGLNTHLYATGTHDLNLDAFKTNVDDIAGKNFKWIRFSIRDQEVFPRTNKSTKYINCDSNPPVNCNPANLQKYDEAVNYADSKGLKIFLVTNVPDWATVYSDPDKPEEMKYSLEDYKIITQDYYEILANRYKGKVVVWNIFNEANIFTFDNYGTTPTLDNTYLGMFNEILKTAKDTINSIDPLTLVTTNTGGYPYNQDLHNQWKQFFDAIHTNLDIISIDPYPDNDETVINALSTRIKEIGTRYSKQIFIAESGMCTGDSHFSEEDQKNYIIKYAQEFRKGGVKGIIFYEVQDDTPNSDNCEASFGFKKADGTPKSIYNPEAEICDGWDNDYDGSIDEGVKNAYYQDSDNDGYGNNAATTEACSAPQGYVSDNTDCNDDDININPEAAEIKCDGIDQDCDGSDDEGTDADTDSYKIDDGLCGDVDCNDNDADINPGVAEVCDGIDNNCDGSVDEGLSECPIICTDSDGGRNYNVKGTVTYNGPTKYIPDTPGGNTYTDACGGLAVNEFYCENDGLQAVSSAGCEKGCRNGACSTEDLICIDTDGGADIYTKGYAYNQETTREDECLRRFWNNIGKQYNWVTVDMCHGTECYVHDAVCVEKGGVGLSGPIKCPNDCKADACVEPECVDGQTQQCGVTDVGECEYGTQTCSTGVWGSCVGEIASTAEICDGFDNDCDDSTDESDVCSNIDYYCDDDGDTFISSAISGSCSGYGCAPIGCIETQGDDCNNNANINPGAAEVCDTVDNDCDGSVDEGADVSQQDCTLTSGIWHEAGETLEDNNDPACDCIPGPDIFCPQVYCGKFSLLNSYCDCPIT